MDEHNVHHFWGISPGIDLGALATRPEASSVGLHDPIRLLQVASYDPRHTLTTLCRASRHLDRHQGPMQLYVHEEEPEVLARHVLLLSVMLDGSLAAAERMHALLELHGNVLLREKTADYLDQRARTLESLLVALSGGSTPDSPEVQCLGADMVCLAQLLDLSLLKFQERDALVEAVHKYRKQVEYDMVKAWDARKRKFYGDRYDFQKNMVDWDYHMRLLVTGAPGQDPANGHIIHFHHFRHWRQHGVAHELRDSVYNQPNRSLLSTAYGRTKEFKDRNLKDVGRSVQAWGFWGDLLNSPYHCFGVTCEDPSFFALSNKQYCRTAVDVAEHNVLALLHELRTGERYSLGGGEAHRAKVARGPTTLQDLEQEANKEQGERDEGEAGNKGERDNREGGGKGKAGIGEQGGEGMGEGQGQGEGGAGSSARGECDETQGEAGEQGGTQGHAGTQEQAGGEGGSADGPGGGNCGAASVSGSGGDSKAGSSGAGAAAEFIAAAAFAGPRAGYVFKKGPGGQGYYRDSAVSEGVLQYQREQQRPEGGDRDGSGGAATAAGAAGGGPGASAASQPTPSPAPAPDGGASVAPLTDAQREEERCLREAEAELDAAAYARLAPRFKLVLVCGDLVKNLTGKAKLHGTFDVVTLGHRHVHLAGPQYQLDKVVKPREGLLVVESARYLLQLKQEQAEAFKGKVVEIAAGAGWVAREDAVLREVTTDVQLLFGRPQE